VASVLDISAEDEFMKNILFNKKSCYTGTAGEWKNFLGEWKKSISPDRVEYSITKNISLDHIEDVEDCMFHTERRLGILLPESYKDFLRSISINNAGGLMGDIFDFMGFIGCKDVGWMKNIDCDYFEILRNAAPMDFDVDDGEYFKYGTDFCFDNLNPRGEEFLLIIGKNSASEYLLLNAEFCSSDGEFEAAYLTPSSIVRYPNFAEMMRQFAAIDCSLVDNIGPASQISLNKIDWIGGKLISDPWWR